MKYVHPFIFALCTIIPMEPDEVCVMCLFEGNTENDHSFLISSFRNINRCFVKVLGLCVKLCSWCRPSMRTSFSPTNRNRSLINWQMMATSWTLRPTWAATWKRWSRECFAVTSHAGSKWYVWILPPAILNLLLDSNLTVGCGVLTEPSCFWLPLAKSWENYASCHWGRGKNPLTSSHQL